MQRRVGVGAAHGFLKRRKNIVMRVAVSVIPHGTALCKLLRKLHGDARLVLASYGSRAKLCRVHCFTYIAAASGSDIRGHAVFEPDFFAEVFRQNAECAVYGAGDLLFFHGLELKHCGAAQNGVIYVKIGVFRCGSDQRDAAVFDELQERLLLLLVEILDLIKVQQNAVYRLQRVYLCHHVANIGGGGRGAV